LNWNLFRISSFGFRVSHAEEGMQISEAEWKETIEELVATLKAFKVPDKEQADLLAVIAGTHDQIVGK
jgi:hypothetical protein